ncbi:PKD domain-containing protein [Thalassotalea piscium]|uniref:Uncharacterized protein n=1 Tax=Thalassotalea piscium TaxID=1230533 RepID=A0A7X0TSA2_9GAMM|nr:hypothetical protein [Thalassotalea piscium]MBB6541921.1 hypothetical protein [Thalassotalea piscium]
MLLSIQSCGGDQPKKVSSNLEIVSIGSDPFIYEQSEVSVTANILASSNSSISFQWQQVSGIPITLENKNQQIVKFTSPNIIANESIKLELIVQDSSGNEDTKIKELTLLYVNTPPVVEVDNELFINALSEVILKANITDEEGDVTSNWQQKSGTIVEITPLQNSSISFKAPHVENIETLTFELTAIDKDGATTTKTITITVLPSVVEIPQHVLLLTNERISKVRAKIAQDDNAWNALSTKLDSYFVKVPYNAGEYAASFALAFYVTGELKYIQRAIELLEQTYFSETDIGWQGYNSRNSFRTGARWAIMGYTWIKSYIPANKQIEIENMLAIWAEFWLENIDYKSDFKSLRVGDSDNLTSLAENITLLGYALKDSSQYASLGEDLLSAGDTLLNRFVVDYYMNDIMAGGAWAEGSDYSANTQRHWIRIFMINKDQRDIAYPTDYAQKASQALIHQTLANYSGVYKYGSEETATDYEPLRDDYRYEFALELMGILEKEKDLAQLYQWFNTLLKREGFKNTSMTTHFQRLLNHNPLFNSNFPAYPESTINFSSGIGLLSARNNWTEEATTLYFINRKLRVDHEHKDALSFDVAHRGNWITKEVTGYGGWAALSLAHNTILIENAENGSSSPTGRPVGKPKYLHVSNDQHTTLISADATNTYNMSGYFATNYAELVNRQLAFIKPNIVITYDHVISLPDQIRDLIQYNDLGLTQGMSHTRWVKTIQHFQSKPEKQENLGTTFLINDGKSKVLFQNIWPTNVNVEVVDEQELWAGVTAYQIPSNQKKWHLSISNKSKTSNSELINIMQFSSEDEDIQFDQEPIVMTKENGFIESNNVIGIAISSQSEKFIILFSQSPNIIIESVEYTLPSGYENALIYGVGVSINN